MNHHITCVRLKTLYFKIKAELFDEQNLYLSAIESYQEFLDNKLYEDEREHVELLLRVHDLLKSACELEKSLQTLETADLLNNSIQPRNMAMFLKLKLMLINQYSKDQIHRAFEVIVVTLRDIKGGRDINKG